MGKGKAIFYQGDPEPPDEYVEFVKKQLLAMMQLRPEIHRALEIEKPGDVYCSVLENGKLALLNFSDSEARLWLVDGRVLNLSPYSIVLAAHW